MKHLAKYIAGMALVLNLGTAGLYAQHTLINMPVSGTSVPSTVNLQVGTTGTSEYDLAGNGSLGKFTLRAVSASAPAPQPSTCAGIYGSVVGGQGVFRFDDGSLLSLNATGGSDCIDLTTQQAHCVRVFQVLGGTGRFAHATGGIVTLTMTLSPVVPNSFVFFTVTGDLTGVVSGVAADDQSHQNRN